MFPKFLSFIFIITIGYLLFQSYGYRYVLDHIRGKASVEMVIGRPNAPTNIITYIDYASESSKQLDSKLVSLLSADPDVNILIRPVATSQNGSELLTRLAFAAQHQGKFMDLHNVLVRSNIDLDEDHLAMSLQSVGINYTHLKTTAYSSKVDEELENTNTELLLLGVESIPSYYIEHVKMEGTSDSLPTLMTIIDKLRAGRL